MKRPIKRNKYKLVTVSELIKLLPYMARDYYTYELQYENEPFYVGKGKRRRMYHHRTEAKKLYENGGEKSDKINFIHDIWKSGNDYIEVKTRKKLINRESLDFEKEDIARYGRICDGTGILTNISIGGQGVVWTEEMMDARYVKYNSSSPVNYYKLCGKTFHKYERNFESNSSWKKRKFCSRICQKYYNKNSKIKYCEWCGKIFSKKNNKNNRKKKHFCGSECQVAAQKKNHTKIKWCKLCNNVFHQNHYSEKEWKEIELCLDCYKIIRKKNYTEIKWCEKCNRVFHKHEGINKKNWEERTKCQKCILSELNIGKVCTEEHKEKVSKAKLGKKHKNPRKSIDQDYKDKIGRTQKRNNQLRKEGKLSIKEKEYEDRCGYCEIKYCQRCKKVFGRFKKMSDRDWKKKKNCCHSCGVNKKT